MNHFVEQISSGKAAEYQKKAGGISLAEGPKALDLYRKFGAFPIGDTATPGGGSSSRRARPWRSTPGGTR